LLGMMLASRREFLGSSIFALAGATAGVISLGGCTSVATVVEPVPTSMGARSAGFGWTAITLEKGSAYAYVGLAQSLTVNSLDIDASLLPSVGAAPPGFSEALCRAWVVRGAVPTFASSDGSNVSPTQASTDFGPISVSNPDNITVSYDAAVLQDIFYSVSLRSWVPADGTAAATARSVSGQPSLLLQAGDYLVFAVSLSGVPGRVALQMTLNYS
jgi:hypothetical protein